MSYFTAKQRKKLGEKIREQKSKVFPGKGGGSRLAERLGVTPQLLSHWIRGAREPSLMHLYHMTALFGISIQDLCGLSRVKRKNEKRQALGVVVEITNFRNRVSNNQKNKRKEQCALETLKSIICIELKDFMQ